jgi:hypothetical protein
MESSLPEVVSTDFPPSSSQVGVADSSPKFSVPRRPPKIPLDPVIIPSPHNEVRLAESVKLQDVGNQINELEKNTAPSEEEIPMSPSEDSITTSSTREEILRRKARQDLIWGAG